eukprot:1145836-Pelagomonas_calceolata.AAC.17
MDDGITGRASSGLSVCVCVCDTQVYWTDGFPAQQPHVRDVIQGFAAALNLDINGVECEKRTEDAEFKPCMVLDLQHELA